jgi:hypothetical protein
LEKFSKRDELTLNEILVRNDRGLLAFDNDVEKVYMSKAAKGTGIFCICFRILLARIRIENNLNRMTTET